MKRQTLANGLLSLTTVAMLTGCVDDKYDLTDIDKTSRFTVDNLTVPINVSEIKLENIIDLDDNENIKKIMQDGKETYAIVKDGVISPTEFSINPIHVAGPDLNPSLFSVAIPGGGMTVTGEGIDIPAIDFPEIPMQGYNFDMHNVDKALLELKSVKTSNPLKVEVTLSIPQGLTGSNNYIAFQNLEIQLPWGLNTTQEGYNQETGLLSIGELRVETDGKAHLNFDATGLDLAGKGEIKNHELNINGQVGIVKGQIKITANDVTLPSSLDIRADYSVSAFDVAYFSGRINYDMDAIHIDPISLNDLPDFLDSPETNLIIADPQILVNIQNPVGKYYLKGTGKIELVSTFKNGKTISRESDEFSLVGSQSSLAFCTQEYGYTYVEFDGLHNVLSSAEGDTNAADGLPKSINVNINEINFAGEVEDFPLGYIGTAEGDYAFNAPLGFGPGSIVVYETTVDGWSSDTLDDVNINTINLNAICSTDLPVSVQVSVTPIDKYGKEIPVKEESALFEVQPKAQNAPVALSIQSLNGPITNLNGVRFHAVVMQNDPDNGEALGPNLHIMFNNIRVTVDGYYETDF